MENPIQPPVQPPAQPPAEQSVPPIQQTPITTPTPQTPPINQIPQTPLTPPIPQPPSATQTPQIPLAPQTPPKSKKGLFVALAIIILLIIFGTLAYSMRKPSSPGVSEVLVSPAATQGVSPTDTNKGSTLLPTGTNDTQLNQDLQSIDTKIGTAESEIGNVDQGLNDQPVNLTE
jgi:hypothetical protein